MTCCHVSHLNGSSCCCSCVCVAGRCGVTHEVSVTGGQACTPCVTKAASGGVWQLYSCIVGIFGAAPGGLCLVLLSARRVSALLLPGRQGCFNRGPAAQSQTCRTGPGMLAEFWALGLVWLCLRQWRRAVDAVIGQCWLMVVLISL